MVAGAIVAGLVVTGRLGGTAGCGNTPTERASCTRILFVGNSYTFVNDLPGVFAELARSGGHRVETGMAAEGGLTLAEHVNSAATAGQLAASRWNLVVLQEQSQIPAFPQSRTGQMYPAARVLVGRIRQAGARPMFFETWAHRDGWPENGLRDYSSMQAQVSAGYEAIARELGVPVARVGAAWATAHRDDPGIVLWQDDGSHPTAAGTYLAACVFYATVFGQSPAGLAYSAGLPADVARTLQQIAGATIGAAAAATGGR
jgi:hypothetical protein